MNYLKKLIEAEIEQIERNRTLTLEGIARHIKAGEVLVAKDKEAKEALAELRAELARISEEADDKIVMKP